MPEQLGMAGFSELFLSPEEREAERLETLDTQREELRERLVEIAEYHTHKEMAARLGREGKTGQGTLGQALKGQNRHKFDLVQDLPIWVASAPNDDLIETISSWRQEPASEREVVVAMAEAALEYMGPAQHRGYIDTVRRRLIRNRRLRRAG